MSTRCPACWSGLDAPAPRCPHCGHRLQLGVARALVRIALPALLVAATTLTIWWLWGRAPGPDPSSGTADRRPRAEESAKEPSTLPAPAEGSPALEPTGQPGALSALRIAGAVPTLFLPLEDLPLRGDLRSPVHGSIAVITYDLARGYALLAGERSAEQPAPRLGDMSSLALGSRLRPGDDGDGSEVEILGRGTDGRLLLDRRVARGTGLFDAGGGVVAYGLGSKQALSLEGVAPWLATDRTRPLAEVQSELRAQDPTAVLEDAAELIQQRAGSLDAIERALALLEGALHLAAPDQRSRFEALQLEGTRMLVRRLADRDPAAALDRARTARLRFGGDAELLLDTLVLCATVGPTDEAVLLYRELQGLDPERAERGARELEEGLRRRAQGYAERDQLAAAVTLLEQAVLLFPSRPQLRMDFARLLGRAGQAERALAEAEYAARLDPVLEAQLAPYRKRVAQARANASRPDRVEIPFDPATRAIRTAVSIGGVRVELVVDTGATVTVVPTALAQRLGLLGPDNPVVQVQTAGGLVSAQRVELPWLSIGAMRLEGVTAVALDLPGTMAGKGLLGMNALERTQMRIDSARGVLILERR